MTKRKNICSNGIQYRDVLYLVYTENSILMWRFGWPRGSLLAIPPQKCFQPKNSKGILYKTVIHIQIFSLFRCRDIVIIKIPAASQLGIRYKTGEYENTGPVPYCSLGEIYLLCCYFMQIAQVNNWPSNIQNDYESI